MAKLEVIDGDVTKLEVDAIANAANTQLRHAGGVAAAISRAGGPTVQRESDEKAPIGLGGPTSAEIVEKATRSTVRKADELGCRSLALVAFGTGVGGFPLEEAARIMVNVARSHNGDLERIVFAVHGSDAERAFREAVG